jgi:energy-coupling factor transport system permease protein
LRPRRGPGGGRTRRGVRYLPGDSAVHRLDPRTKLLVLISVSLAALMVDTPLPLLPLLGFAGTAALASGLWREWVGSLRLMVPLIIVVVVLDLFVGEGSYPPLFAAFILGPLTLEITAGSIRFALAMGLRLLAIGGTSFLFIMTTGYNDFVRSLKCLGLPNILCFSLGYALRSTSFLGEDVMNIMDAQRSRGMVFSRGSLVRNVRPLLALFIPLSVSVLNRSRHTADAMQSRGFGGGPVPTCFRPPRFGAADAAAVLLLSLVLLLAFSLPETAGLVF